MEGFLDLWQQCAVLPANGAFVHWNLLFNPSFPYQKSSICDKKKFLLLYSFLLDDNISLCFPGSSLIKNLPTNARDTGSIPGLRRTPGEGKGNPFHNYCLGNPTDRWAWRATVQIGHKTVRHNLVTKQQQQLRFLYSSTKICITYFICKICI